jgi:ketosteroid isomerase-like protein
MATTTEVVQHHLQSFGAGDLGGILSDYAPDALLFTPEGTLRGPAAIRTLFVAMLEEFSKPGSDFKLQQKQVDGDHAYIVWTAQTADNLYELGTDTFYVREGKIVVQSFAGKITPRH